ncbi:MAG TPA: signal recognition particle protein [bacterium]|nr:signal recognition particle protein [bacterium]
MFDDLIRKLDGTVRKIRGTGRLSEKNIAESMREIRRVLLEADVHFKVAGEFVDAIGKRAVGQEVLRSVTPGQQVVKIVHDELIRLLGGSHAPIRYGHIPPTVIMVVGLQGSGKTTFCGKLAVHLRKQNRNPMLAAADVYRPAAIEQLQSLGNSIQIPVFALGTEVTPEEIAVKAVTEARKTHRDVLILDTAGRLHIDETMMNELIRIRDAVKPSEIIFVADGMTGQDAVRSAQAFQEAVDFDGIALTKLDGDSKGGAALSIRSVTGKPIKFISNGENPDAIEAFHPDRMASRILGMGDVVGLVEKAREAVDLEEAEKHARRLGKEAFTFEDFLDQLRQIKKMGPLSQVMGMVPGLNLQAAKEDVDDSALVKAEAIINSMTLSERRKPNLIDGSRRKRIARGSGTTVQDVNQLIRQFQGMQKMMKHMGRLKMKGMPGGLPFGR